MNADARSKNNAASHVLCSFEITFGESSKKIAIVSNETYRDTYKLSGFFFLPFLSFN